MHVKDEFGKSGNVVMNTGFKFKEENESVSLTFLNHIRDIKDPEHPYSLEDLKVITEDAIEVDDKRSYVR